MSITHEEHGCIVAATRIIGDKWNPRLLYALSQGVSGFCAIQRELDGVNPRTLSDRLDRLEAEGIITKSAEDSEHKVRYTLTKKGRELLPIFKQMAAWSLRYGQKHP